MASKFVREHLPVVAYIRHHSRLLGEFDWRKLTYGTVGSVDALATARLYVACGDTLGSDRLGTWTHAHAHAHAHAAYPPSPPMPQ